jgi:hypothetical protein
LEGKDEAAQQKNTDDGDIPSKVEMNDCAYLVSGKFRRVGMDFEKSNVTAHWLKLVMQELYSKTCCTTVADLNRALVRGKREFLVDDSEENKDRRILSKLFELTPDDLNRILEVERALSATCSIPRPHRLPMPDPLPDWPVVGTLGDRRRQLLAYEPLVDLTMLKGSTASQAKSATLFIDGAAQKSHGTVPSPKTEPDLGGFMWPDATEVKLTDLPEYQPLNPPRRKRPKIPAAMDPFPRPFLFIASFEEESMPEFNLLPGGPKASEAKPVPLNWLHPEETELRPPPMPPLLDHPLWPPIDLVDNENAEVDATGKKKFKKRIVVRGLWEPELYTQGGRMIPPLKDRVRKMEVDLDFDHDENCGIADVTTEAKNRSEMLDELIPVIPVKSMARFSPKPQSLEFPDFLLDIVRHDWANQDVFNVIEQRHGVLLNEMKKEAELAEEEAAALGKPAEDGAEVDFVQQDADPRVVETGEGAPTLEVTLRQPVPGTAGTGDAQGLSGTSPPSTSGPGAARPGSSGSTRGQAPAFAEDVVPPTMERPSSAMRGLSAPVPPTPGSGGSAALSDPRSALAQHQRRVREQVERSRDERTVEQMLTDDRFVEILAEKISDRLGIAQIPGRTANHATGQHRRGAAGTGHTMTGHEMTGMVRPEPPSFLEPEDIASQATLPRALQGTTTQATTDAQAEKVTETVTESDVNSFTQEKARGDAYVRLLVKPEAHAAMKEIQEYKPQTSEPDPRLLMTQKYRTEMPKKPPKIGEDGEYYEDDDFEDVEPSNVVVFSFVRHNRYEAVEELIQQDPSVLNNSDEKGNNLLHVACQNNNRRLAKLLTKAGINLNKQNNNGNTSLHYCYAYAFTQLAEFLIAKGADESLSNHDGKLPYEGLGSAETEQTGAQKHLQAIRSSEM